MSAAVAHPPVTAPSSIPTSRSKSSSRVRHRLVGSSYEVRPKSELLPDLDIPQVVSFVDVDALQLATVKRYRAALRGE